jgi:hypothetical protein
MTTMNAKDANAAGLSATPVHMLINDACARSDLTNQSVARSLGYPKGNVIAMFRSGDMKLPVNKVEPLARVLGLDPADLLRRVLREYTPDLWDALNSLMGEGGTVSTMTVHERSLLAFVRSRLGGRDLNILADETLKSSIEQSLDAMLDAAQRSELDTHFESRRISSSNMAYNQAMKELIKRQAEERESLRGLLGRRVA